MITTKESAVIYVEENIIPSHKEKCLQLLSDIDYGELKNDKAKRVLPYMLVLIFKEFDKMSLTPNLKKRAINIIGPVEITNTLNRIYDSIDNKYLIEWDNLEYDFPKMLAEEFVQGAINKVYEEMEKTLEKELNNISKNENHN